MSLCPCTFQCRREVVKSVNQEGKQPTRTEVDAAHSRLSLFGNAVVPDQARHAYIHLMSAKCGSTETKPVTGVRRFPDCGLVRNKNFHALAPPLPLHLRPPLPIVLDAKLYNPPQGYRARNILKPLRRRVTRDYWATPRASLTTSAQVMTERTSHDLATQVRNTVTKPVNEKTCGVHPEFGEWLMGLASGWTAACTNRPN